MRVTFEYQAVAERQMLPQLQGFLKMIINQEYHPSHQDKRLINMISTLHTTEVIETTSRRTGVAKKKPKCIIDYNTHMHGVDTADQYLAYYPFICKTVKWPKKVFFYLLQCCFSTVMLPFQRIILIPANHS